MMKAYRLFLPFASLALAAINFACDDDTSQIGNSLTDGNVSIYVDSLTFDLQARGVENLKYDSRSGSLLLGSINVPEYGSLRSSFVSRMMCATQLGMPEDLDISLIDSCEMVLNMTRGNIVGDSLAPQRVDVYKLNVQIPNDITNQFDPVASIGYDNMELLGSKTFTASQMGSLSDSVFITQNALAVRIPLGKDYGDKIFLEYKNNPETFQWPQTFAENFLPGIFVETSFGRGCVSNINTAGVIIFYHTLKDKTETVDDKEVTTTVVEPDTVMPFIVSPEVLSSNNINFKVAESLKNRIENGEIILTTPGGYNAKFNFPAEQIIARYKNEEHNLSVVSDLSLTIPAEPVENNYGMTTVPNLLLVKTSEADDFFKKNKLPDNKTSFTASFDETNGKYTFSSMRNYLLDLINKPTISPEDVEFSLIPIYLKEENQYDSSGNITATYVTGCNPYTLRPTMTRLHTEKALIIFSFSSQKFD